MTVITTREAISLGLREALDNDERVFLMGEDIAHYGGAYAVTKDFLKDYGDSRIRDTPICEDTIIGAAVGSSMGGMRPIVEIMSINFALLGMDQIINHAAKLRYMSDGQLNVPIIIRTVTGGGGQLAATHSQSFEGWFASVPGLKVAVPAYPCDALGLMRSALLEEDPVIYVEHGLLYKVSQEKCSDSHIIPFGKANITREGSDISLIAYSRMSHVAYEAANILESENGLSVEVIDLRTLNPLDIDTIVSSVKKTNQAMIIEEMCKTGGFASEIISEIQERIFDYLDGPINRINHPDIPTPYAKNLEQVAIPNKNAVVKAVKKQLNI